MSYDILYRRSFIKVSDTKTIPVVEGGSNNCYESGRGSKMRRTRDWYNLTYITDGKIIAENSDIEAHIMKDNAELIQRNEERNKDYIANGNADWIDVYSPERWGYFTAIAIQGCSTRGTSFSAYKNFIMGGIKRALTVEQLRGLYINVHIQSSYDYNGEMYKEANKEPLSKYPKTTEELIQMIEEGEKYFAGTKISIGVTISASEYDLEKLIKAKTKKETKFVEKENYFVFASLHGYLVKFTRRGFRYSPYQNGTSNKRAFTEKEAQKMLAAINNRSCTIWHIESVNEKVFVKIAV